MTEPRTGRAGRLHEAEDLIRDKILKTVTTGTADRPRRRSRLDVAADHANEWAGTAVPREGERGSTRSGVEEEERIASARVKWQAVEDARRIAQLSRLIRRHTGELSRIVDRYVETVDPRKLPAEAPGCRSCARTSTDGNDVKIGGHWAPVREDVAALGLCDWCYRHRDAGGNPPPIKACDLKHTQGGRAVARYLAGLERGRAA